MNKKVVICIISIIAIIIGITIFRVTETKQEEAKDQTETEIGVVLSLEDNITNNTVWCGTFNLIWNDLKNDLAKQDIEFTPQIDIVKNLNKGTFNTSYLSEDSYYKVCDTPSLELKAKIEKAIKEKFNETSDILDDFGWDDAEPGEAYFLYTMLKKDFEFPNEFDELEDGKFGDYDNVKYFGINEDTEEQVREQVQVLYYNSKNDFAIKLLTKGNDEVIITRGNNKTTFGEAYNEVIKQSEKYNGNTEMGEKDILKIPNISFNLKEELTELENKSFFFSTGEEYYIDKALQTIEFELDKKGGKIKSEAGMMVENFALAKPDEETREFLVDDTFTIFLKEEEKYLPYFAARIEDITKVQ